MALKAPNDQRPQVLLSGQNIHVRFFSAMKIKKVPINMDTLVLLFPKRIAFRINILLEKF
ncbi:hypothetical protein AMR71_11195 [Bacillus altitudinis]|nr:hypothetical protein AMR71_11195 [Bacillus altitudinis]KML12727.1 hypothetical protein VL09_17125 [Bacillus stratosphericus]KMN75375.1 hypothetical protein VK97_03810 [Bacillus sp. LK10]MBW3699304.1 hypothetical protein [Bacillus aerophilus]ANY97259.1 hypothetical protein AKO66_11200 [Bacillus altitudinis]